MKKIFLLIMIFAITSLNAKNLEPVSYWDMQNVSNPKVSPSNELIVFSKRYIDKQNDSFKNGLHFRNEWIYKIVS